VQWQYGFADFREQAAISNSVVSAAPGGVGTDKAANAGAATTARGRDQINKVGGSSESQSKAAQSVAGKAQGKEAATPEEPKPAEANAPEPLAGPWEEARWSYPEFTAVGKDVLIRVDCGLKSDLGRQFAAKAFAKVP
jgi:hypothetical protein